MQTRKYITCQNPENEGTDGYKSGNTLIYDFSWADYEYINLSSLIHSFVLKFVNVIFPGQIVDRAEEIIYVGNNRIIQKISIMTLNGTTLLQYDDYHLLCGFHKNFLKQNKPAQDILDDYKPFKRCITARGNPAIDNFFTTYAGCNNYDLNVFPHHERLIFTHEDDVYINKNFKILITLNDIERCITTHTNSLNLLQLIERNNYTFKNPVIYYKGKNALTGEEKNKKVSLYQINELLMEVTMNVKKYDFFLNPKSKANFTFIYNNNTFIWNDNEDNIRNVRQYNNDDYDYERQYYVTDVVTTNGSSLFSSHMIASCVFVPPEYLRVEATDSNDKKHTYDLGKIYLFGSTQNLFIPTLENMDVMKETFDVSLEQNIKNIARVNDGLDMYRLMAFHYFCPLIGNYKSVSVSVVRPTIPKGLDHPKNDILVNIQLVETNTESWV